MELRTRSFSVVFALVCIPCTVGIATHSLRSSAASVGFQHPTANFWGLVAPNSQCPSAKGRALRRALRAAPCLLNPMREISRKTVLAASAGESGEEPQNATASSFVEPGLPKGLRPIGVDDRIEGISQAPLYEEYSQKAAPGGVGSKIGLEKQEGGQKDAEAFAFSSKEETAQDRMAREEFNLVSAFSQEQGFLGAGIGIIALLFVYTSLYNGGSSSLFGNYGGEGAAPAGKTVVVERYEEAYLCYGIPSPNDPNGCRDKRSVGPVRVFSKAPVEGPDSAAEAAPASE